jgi:carotenoid cleavage dioxygenase-like enzyme
MTLDLAPSTTEVDRQPQWHRAFDNIAHEHGFEPLRVEGRIPDDLRGGTVYRNGPGTFSRGGERIAHMFDGDGVIAATRFTSHGAEGAVRFVRTKWRDREEKAHRWLHGGYKQPFRRPIRDILLGGGKNTANTGVLSYQGRLFALCEAGKPFELDPEHLTTLGEEDFGVNVQTFNAHPKRIASRRATYSIGLRLGRTHHLDVWELPDLGKPRRLTTFPVGQVGMVHDFALTERHIVLFLPPQRLRLSSMLFGQRGIVDATEWDSRTGTEIVTIPLDSPSEIRRFRTESFYMEHVANAYEEEGEIVIDFTRFENLASFENLVQPLVHLRVGEPMSMSLSRMKLSASQRTATCETLLDEVCELPHTSSAVRGRRHTVTYLAGQPDQDHPYDVFAATLKIDHVKNAIERFSFGQGSISGEPLFVQRAGAEREDDGYLLVLVFDPTEDVSYEAVFDARRLSDGPIARAYHQQPIPPRFHGAWTRAA